VQQRRDGKIFIASRFKHLGRNPNYVRNVGDGRCLAGLPGVFFGGE
jgi:hypothetical protein